MRRRGDSVAAAWYNGQCRRGLVGGILLDDEVVVVDGVDERREGGAHRPAEGHGSTYRRGSHRGAAERGREGERDTDDDSVDVGAGGDAGTGDRAASLHPSVSARAPTAASSRSRSPGVTVEFRHRHVPGEPRCCGWHSAAVAARHSARRYCTN